MSSTIVSKVRLFPLLILVAGLALGLRAVDLYTGINLLGEQAIAQDSQESQDATDSAEQQDDNTDAPQQGRRDSRSTIVVGLPSKEEEQVLLQLRQRREELESRERELDLQRQLLASTETSIDNKIKQLQVLEGRIKEHLRLFDEREDAQLKSVVAVYEKMKPKDAAPRFEQLTRQIQLDLATRMKAAKVAEMMAKMNPEKAKILTEMLATRAAPPSIEEIQAAGS